MPDPSLLYQPTMPQNVSHHIHFYPDCVDDVIPQLFAHPVDRLEEHEQVSIQNSMHYVASACMHSSIHQKSLVL